MNLRNRLLALGASGFLATAGAFIGLKEGLVLHPYADVGGVQTWCYGQTGKGAKATYTMQECDATLLKDITKRWEQMSPSIPTEAPASVKASMLSEIGRAHV